MADSTVHLNPPDEPAERKPQAGATPPADWRPLNYLNLYRLILAGVFVTLYTSKIGPNFFEHYNPRLFATVSGSYLLFAMFSSFTIRMRRPAFAWQVMFQGLGDITAIGLLVHAAGGVESGLGMLLVVAIAGSSVLTEGRTAFFFAAVASLVILTETALAGFYEARGQVYAQAGILGAAFFTTAFLVHFLAQKIRVSESLAKLRGLHLQHLSHLNEQIVAHIQSGIIVTNAAQRIQLFNEAAARLLGVTDAKPGNRLEDVQPNLALLVSEWRRTANPSPQLYRPANGEVDVLVSFTRLKQAGMVSILMTLEDATLTSRRAHELKLASLGRLTASIAHEVRNPLGAISHAGQLLAESSHLTKSDNRLVEIILEHSQRVNKVVENVLQLSRQREAERECFSLSKWLPEFTEKVLTYYNLDRNRVLTEITVTDVTICFDPDQLHQVLWNLCENALRYSPGTPGIKLCAGVNQESGRPYLDIWDFGTGMPAEIANHIFEPFFTGEPDGTGLGLYLARGFCESNQASLHLVHNDATGCCFRISFSALHAQEIVI